MNTKKQVPVWAIAGFVLQFLIVIITVVIFAVRVDDKAEKNAEDIIECKGEFDEHVRNSAEIKTKLNQLETDSEWIIKTLEEIKDDLKNQ